MVNMLNYVPIVRECERAWKTDIITAPGSVRVGQCWDWSLVDP